MRGMDCSEHISAALILRLKLVLHNIFNAVWDFWHLDRS